MRWMILLLAVACSATPSPTAVAGAPSHAPVAPVAPAAPAAPAGEAPAAVEPAPGAPAIELGRWTRELAEPAISIGVGKRRVAVLTTKSGRYASAWMRDGTKWSDLKLPERMLAGEGERDALRIWFGRDDRPRVMGARYRADGSGAMVYLRWKETWRDKAGEIGRLDAVPLAPLFGILGHDDPEVVCKLGDTCIIKRLTGWTMIPPPPEELWVELSGKHAVGVGATTAWRLGEDGWKALSETVPWAAAPGGLWASAGDTVWVTEPAKNRLHRWDGAGWSSHPSPQAEPRAIWGRGDDDLWLAAGGGAAHWDGQRWSRLAEPKGSLSDVRGGFDGAIWLAGETGVWRGDP
jgi:hypothetical protein